VPNWGQEPDKTFDVRLTDAVTTHDIYLTRLVFEPTLYRPSSPESARNSLVSRRAQTTGGGGPAGLLAAALLVGGGLAAVVLLSLAVGRVCRSATAAGKQPAVVSEKDAVVYDVSRADVVMATPGACPTSSTIGTSEMAIIPDCTEGGVSPLPVPFLSHFRRFFFFFSTVPVFSCHAVPLRSVEVAQHCYNGGNFKTICIEFSFHSFEASWKICPPPGKFDFCCACLNAAFLETERFSLCTLSAFVSRLWRCSIRSKISEFICSCSACE